MKSFSVSDAGSQVTSGSFDVTFAAATGTVTINPAGTKIYYTKIGKRVLVHSDNLTVQSVSSPTGDLKIAGIPAIILPNSFSTLAVFASSLTAGAVTSIVARVDAGVSTILLRRFNAGGTVLDLATLLSPPNTFFILSGTWMTA